MAHLFQVGVGSGGMVVLDLLARHPAISRVTIVDPDGYQPHNVVRHLFPASWVGQPKVELARAWLQERRPDLPVECLVADLMAPDQQPVLNEMAAVCAIGVCAVDNEAAKYHFDHLMRMHRKPWTLGEVLSGGIAGWVHRFVPQGPCYGCVAGHLLRAGPQEAPPAPLPDYSQPQATITEATIPADRASISTIASLHATVTLALLEGAVGPVDWTSLLMPLRRVPGVFEEAYRPVRVQVAPNLSCLICTQSPAGDLGENLDVALDQALARLGPE